MRALAISPDGKQAVSGSFDTAAIRWSLTRNVAEQVMRFHDGAVNAVAWLKDGRIATAGGDGSHCALDAGSGRSPTGCSTATPAPIVDLAVSPDGKTLASASWDHTVRLWPLDGGAPRVLEGNTQNVNGVAFSPDGKQSDQRRLRQHAAHLAARSRRPDRAHAGIAAQQRGGRARRRDRHRRRQRQGLFPLAQGRDARRGAGLADADHRRHRLARRQAYRRRRHPRLGGGHRPQDSASSRAR